MMKGESISYSLPGKHVNYRSYASKVESMRLLFDITAVTFLLRRVNRLFVLGRLAVNALCLCTVTILGLSDGTKSIRKVFI